MTRPLGWILSLLCACALAWPGAAAFGDPAADYLHTLRELGRAPLPVAQLAAAQQNPVPYQGGVFQMTATIGGLISADDTKTVMLETGPSGGPGSLIARLPASLTHESWIDTGRMVRALVRVERKGNEVSLSNLTVLAMAPEFEVAQAERASAIQTRSAPLPSRSTGYSRSGRPAPYSPSSPASGSDPEATAGAPIAPLSERARSVYSAYRVAVAHGNRRLSEPDIDKITTSILYFSEQYDVDPRLIIAMITAESDFDIHCTSHAGAMGLGQLMPENARELGLTDPYDPVQNIGGAVHLLRGHLDQYGGAPAHAGVIPDGQLALTMAAYNAGPGAVKKYHGIPPYHETQHYVVRVTALYKKLCGG